MMLERKPYRKWNASAFGGKKLTLLVIIAAWFSRANLYIFCGWAQKTRLGKSGICARLRATGRIWPVGSSWGGVASFALREPSQISVRDASRAERLAQRQTQEIGHMFAAVIRIHLLYQIKEKRKFLNAMVVNSPWLFLRRLQAGRYGARGSQSPNRSYPEALGATVDQGNEANMAATPGRRPHRDTLCVEICPKTKYVPNAGSADPNLPRSDTGGS